MNNELLSGQDTRVPLSALPLREELARNEMLLRNAWGDPIPPCTAAMRARADAAVQRLSVRGEGAVADLSAFSGWTQGIDPGLLVDLASVYRSCREEKYALVAKEVYACRLRVEWTGKDYVPAKDPLAIPHRLGDTECVGWFGVLPEFLPSDCFDDAFVAWILGNVRQDLNHLCHHLHPARNIRMTQMDALLTQGLRLRFLQDAEQWRDTGMRGLNDCFYRQFNPDGSSIEATGWYHYIVANMAFRFLRLKRAMPELGLQVTERLVADAFDYTTAMIAPDGTFNRIGDCTAGVHPYPTLDAFLRHRAAVRRELGFPDALPPCRQFYPDAGQVLLRESWEPGSTYITFDATRRMGYHWHPACNAIQLQVGPHRLIADPGRLRYDPTPHRKMAISTRAHSTLTVNGWSQSDSFGSLTFKQTDGYTIATGLYDGGYWPMQGMEHGRGVFGSHHRTLLWVQGRFLVVIDSLHHTEGEGNKPSIESNWQLGQSRVTMDAEHGRLVSRQGDAGLLMLFALPSRGLEFRIHEGGTDPCLGWIANERDCPVPAPLVQASLPTRDPWRTDLATVLIPFADGQVPGVHVMEPVDPETCPFGRVALQWDDGAVDTVLWTPRLLAALGCAGDIRTDAALVHHRTGAGGAIASGMVYEGTYLEPLLSRGREMHQTFSIPAISGAGIS